MENISNICLKGKKNRCVASELRSSEAIRLFFLPHRYYLNRNIAQLRHGHSQTGIDVSEGAYAEEDKVPRNTEAEVKQYGYDEIDAAVAGINDRPAVQGRVAKGAAMALKMRYAHLFTLEGRSSSEVILSVQHLLPNKGKWLITLPNNADSGWSSMVPPPLITVKAILMQGLP